MTHLDQDLRQVAIEGGAAALWDLYRSSELVDTALGQLSWEEIFQLTQVPPTSSYAAAMSESGLMVRTHFLQMTESVVQPYPTTSA